MNTYISMLRGINVGGTKKVPMADLKKLYEELGFEHVRTYIQSGNVIFNSNEKIEKLATKIEKKILEKFGFEVPILLKTERDLLNVLKENPYLKEKNLQEDKLYVTFLYGLPNADLAATAKTFENKIDRFTIIEDNIYLYFAEGYGKSTLNNNFFEKKLNVKGTTRNWRTVNELLKLAQANK